MTGVFLSPHNDDEALFGSFILQRHKPHVIVVFKSFVQEVRYGVMAETREAETGAAMKELGCTWEQWDISDSEPDMPELHKRVLELKDQGIEELWVPAHIDGGHVQHNALAAIGGLYFPEKVSYYTTYRMNPYERHVGRPLPFNGQMISKKLRALSCYTSQLSLAWMYPHFVRGLEEYYDADVRSYRQGECKRPGQGGWEE